MGQGMEPPQRGGGGYAFKADSPEKAPSPIRRSLQQHADANESSRWHCTTLLTRVRNSWKMSTKTRYGSGCRPSTF